MHYKYTLLPGIALLFVIPFVYGTANLDCVQSADCLERMAALIGIPMFTPLIRQEHSRGLYETIAFRQVSLKFIVFLRIVLSVIGSILLILVFALYMRFCGCSFPLFPYAFRTLAASMTLGFTGLLLSSIVRNTIGGYLCAFCFYFYGTNRKFRRSLQACYKRNSVFACSVSCMYQPGNGLFWQTHNKPDFIS